MLRKSPEDRILQVRNVRVRGQMTEVLCREKSIPREKGVCYEDERRKEEKRTLKHRHVSYSVCPRGNLSERGLLLEGQEEHGRKS